MSDEELKRTLALRLDLGEETSAEELDEALAFVEEPEILSDDATNLGSAPDLGHADDAGGPTGDRT